MTTKDLIKQLHDIDPTGNKRIILLHRDEYLTDSILYAKKINKGQLNKYMQYIEGAEDLDLYSAEKQFVLIVPFND